MSLAETAPPGRARRGLRHLFASPRFHSLVSAVPGLRRLARRDGEALFDLVAGFVHSQVLMAVVELGVLHRLMDGPAASEELGHPNIPPDRLTDFLEAAAALGLVRRRADGLWVIARQGAALLGVPGLEAMIRHHAILYRDMAEPTALLRGDDTELSSFWPYVFGAGAAKDPATARRYSDLMADSQALVAEETLRRVDLSGASEILDIGGGTGAFLTAVGHRHAGSRLHLFDLPAVLPEAEARFAAANLTDRVTITPGSFRDDSLPTSADIITLIRVLYDHQDDTVLSLLTAIHRALPPSGRIVVSEPMKGHKATDTYFTFYCMAMQSGRARHPRQIASLLEKAGFSSVKDHGTTRPFITHVLSARRN
ncbi:MAG: methyltransferase [Pseudomonadota bacterium]